MRQSRFLHNFGLTSCPTTTALSLAIESSTILDLFEAPPGIKLGRSRKHLEDAKKIALRRSGARGADARKTLLKAESRVAVYVRDVFVT